MKQIIKQKTIAFPVSINSSTGFLGKNANITFNPGAPNTGIVFRRVDLPDSPSVKASYLNIDHSNNHSYTSLDQNGVKIYVVEHLLSSISALGIDNLEVNIDSCELPIVDGSSSPFIFALQVAGIIEQQASKKFLKIEKPVHITRPTDQAAVSIHPQEPLEQIFMYQLEYENGAADCLNGNLTVHLSFSNYVHQIARARTFGFSKDLSLLDSIHPSHGFSYNNAMFLDNNGELNDAQSFRLGQECARHKILDAVGDLFLTGYSILGRFSGYKSGHELNAQLIQKLMSDESNFSLIECEVNSYETA